LHRRVKTGNEKLLNLFCRDSLVERLSARVDGNVGEISTCAAWVECGHYVQKGLTIATGDELLWWIKADEQEAG
jgi:hypothetical protein